MNLSKSLDFFNPFNYQEPINIIGCGAVGSTLAELLARFGFTKFNLFDFDIVEEKNLANQMFNASDVGKLKVQAVGNLIYRINPLAKDDIKVFPEGYQDHKLSGYVFLCVDNIELRQKICKDNENNTTIKGIFDFRTRLLEGQHYAADWSKEKDKKVLLSSMDFKHEDVKEEESACHVILGVAPTVRAVVTAGVCNFVNWLKTGELRQLVISKPFDFDIMGISYN